MLNDTSQHLSFHLFFVVLVVEFSILWGVECKSCSVDQISSRRLSAGRMLLVKVLHTVHVQLRLQSVTDSHDDSIHPSRFLSILEAHTSENSERIFFFLSWWLNADEESIQKLRLPNRKRQQKLMRS